MVPDIMATIRKLALEAAAEPQASPAVQSVCELIRLAALLGARLSEERPKPTTQLHGDMPETERVAVARIVLSEGATRKRDDSLVVAGSHLRNAVIDIIDDAAEQYRDASVRDRIALVQRVQADIEGTTGILPDVDQSKHALESWAMRRRPHPRDRKWTVIAELWGSMVSHPVAPEAVRKAYVRRAKR